MPLTTSVVVVAAGKGNRMGSDLPKQFMEVAGRPLIYYALHTFERCAEIDSIIPVIPSGYEAFVEQDIVSKYHFNKVKKVVRGGEYRQDSVFCGLREVPADTTLVAIHDGARPFVTIRLVADLLKTAEKNETVIPCVAIRDTIKRTRNDTVLETVDRTTLTAVQTPQVFRRAILETAFNKAYADKARVTDDAALLERIGVPVHIVEGEVHNIKITTSEDLAFAEYFIESGKWHSE